MNIGNSVIYCTNLPNSQTGLKRRMNVKSLQDGAELNRTSSLTEGGTLPPPCLVIGRAVVRLFPLQLHHKNDDERKPKDGCHRPHHRTCTGAACNDESNHLAGRWLSPPSVIRCSMQKNSLLNNEQ